MLDVCLPTTEIENVVPTFEIPSLKTKHLPLT
jgi:hypothetical protein